MLEIERLDNPSFDILKLAMDYAGNKYETLSCQLSEEQVELLDEVIDASIMFDRVYNLYIRNSGVIVG